MKKIGSTVWNWIETIALFFLRLLFRIMKKDVTKEAEESFMQFIKFGVVGVSNTAVSYLTYVGSLLLLRKAKIFPQTDYLIGTVVGFILSVLWSFYWNNKFVFKIEEGEHRSPWKALLKTYMSYAFTGLFLNSILMVMWVQVFHVSEFLGPIFNLLLSVPINFLINKFWAFKKDEA